MLDDERVNRWKNWRKYIGWARGTALIVYVLHTQFERPDWCLRILNKIKNDPSSNYENFSGDTCNNDNESYTSFNLPKIPPIFSWIIQILCLLI